MAKIYQDLPCKPDTEPLDTLLELLSDDKHRADFIKHEEDFHKLVKVSIKKCII